MPKKPMPIEQKFMALAKQGKPDECWIWPAAKTPLGYGVLRHPNYGPLEYTHRIAWRILRPDKPIGSLCVLHRCDNPPCWNPSHLFLGTKGDNQSDMAKKGRSARGEKAGRHILTEKTVLEIRRQHCVGTTNRQIASRMKLKYDTVKAVTNRRSWKYL